MKNYWLDIEPEEREKAIDNAYAAACDLKKKSEMEENVFYREVNMVEDLLGNFIFSTASTRD